MPPFKNWPRPLRICAAYLPALAAILLWFWVESGGGQIDASVHRSALYCVYFLILPAGIAAFLIHLLATLGTPRTLNWRFAISGITGSLGLLTLHLMIKTSSDGEAAMAYLASGIAFTVFAIAGFGFSTLAFYVANQMAIRRQRRLAARPRSSNQ